MAAGGRSETGCTQSKAKQGADRTTLGGSYTSTAVSSFLCWLGMHHPGASQRASGRKSEAGHPSPRRRCLQMGHSGWQRGFCFSTPLQTSQSGQAAPPSIHPSIHRRPSSRRRRGTSIESTSTSSWLSDVAANHDVAAIALSLPQHTTYNIQHTASSPSQHST